MCCECSLLYAEDARTLTLYLSDESLYNINSLLISIVLQWQSLVLLVHRHLVEVAQIHHTMDIGEKWWFEKYDQVSGSHCDWLPFFIKSIGSPNGDGRLLDKNSWLADEVVICIATSFYLIQKVSIHPEWKESETMMSSICFFVKLTAQEMF